MQTILKYINAFLPIIISMFAVTSLFAQQKAAKGGYGDMLYPYAHDYSQTLCYKIGIDYGNINDYKKLNANEVLQIIERIDNFTRGIPKIVYLVGWQYTGHDTGYPSFSKVNSVLKRDEDKSALESLRWIMREGPKYNTLVSLHVNFSDCYIDDNPLGPEYISRDIIVRETDGRHREGYAWNNHMAYRASNYRNWYQGTFRDKQIDPLFKMIPELQMSGSLHPDAWYNTNNPYYQIDKHQDCLGMREMTVYVREKYNVDLTTEFDWGRPQGEDFILYHPMIWHTGWNTQNPPWPMKIPPYFMTGGDAFFWGNGGLAEHGKFFGHSATFESEINASIDTIPGGLKTFALQTLPWYFLNRQLREKFDGDTAWFSNNIVVTYKDKPVITQNGHILQEGNDVFIPALWKSQPEIIAYSEEGYRNRSWKLPEIWNEIESVDIYSLSINGSELIKKNQVIASEKELRLSLNPDQGVFIIPSGVDPNREIATEVSGEVTFVGIDKKSKGSWKESFGANGYVIPGIAEKLPNNVDVKQVNGSVQVWKDQTQDIQAIELPDTLSRIASAQIHPLHEAIEFKFEDGNEHEVSIYFLDWDHRGRWNVVDIIDPISHKVLHSYNLTDYEQGVYLTYKMRGHVVCRITNVWTQRYQKSPNAAFSAIFFNTIN